MLKENHQSRPNIYQVLKEACAMQNREIPIHDVSPSSSLSNHTKYLETMPLTSHLRSTRDGRAQNLKVPNKLLSTRNHINHPLLVLSSQRPSKNSRPFRISYQ